MGIGMGKGSLQAQTVLHNEELLEHMEPFPWGSHPVPLGGLFLLTAACAAFDASQTCPALPTELLGG